MEHGAFRRRWAADSLTAGVAGLIQQTIRSAGKPAIARHKQPVAALFARALVDCGHTGLGKSQFLWCIDIQECLGIIKNHPHCML
jgi:hypothetical protein